MLKILIVEDEKAISNLMYINLKAEGYVCTCAFNGKQAADLIEKINYDLGALVGVPVFFLLKPRISISAAALVMIVIMLPFFLFAMYEKNGMSFEEILKNMIEVRLKRPASRPYQTNNFYTVLHKQAALDKEVMHIVQKNSVNKTHASRPQGNRRSGRKSAWR